MTASGTVVSTGAFTVIGDACALHLGELGFRIFAGVRREADAQYLKTRASGRSIAPLFLDLTDRSSIVSAAETVAEATEEVRLWGLVNNAGVAVAGPLEFFTRRAAKAAARGQCGWPDRGYPGLSTPPA